MLLFGLVVYTIGGIGCAFADSIDELVLFRLLQGIGGCVGRVMGPAIVRDEFHAQQGAQVLSYVTLVMALAPLVAPMIGGYLLVVADWQAIFVVLAGFGAVVLAVIAARFGESSKHRDPRAMEIASLLRNYGRFLAHRACLGYALINCFVFAGLFSYISGSSFVFIEVFGLPSQVYGILFGVTATAFMAGASLNGRFGAGGRRTSSCASGSPSCSSVAPPCWAAPSRCPARPRPWASPASSCPSSSMSSAWPSSSPTRRRRRWSRCRAWPGSPLAARQLADGDRQPRRLSRQPLLRQDAA